MPRHLQVVSVATACPVIPDTCIGVSRPAERTATGPAGMTLAAGVPVAVLAAIARRASRAQTYPVIS